jgi:hypothetical protein
VDLAPRHSGLAQDITRVTPGGEPFLVHPNDGNVAQTPGNCHRAATFRALAEKNISCISESDNPICLSCHSYQNCRHTMGDGFGYRFQRHCVLQRPQVRAHPDSLPAQEDYKYFDCGMIWDEASQTMRSRSQIKVTLSDFNQTVGELAIAAPELFARLLPLFETLKFLLWGRQIEEDSELENDTLPKPQRYGYDDTAIRQLLGTPPEDLGEIIDSLAVKLTPDLSFLTKRADSIDATVGGTAERATSRRINKLLAKHTYAEALFAVEAVFLNWLIPLLQVWFGCIRGALQFDKGTLTIHQEDTRHRDVANAAKFNIYLDATLDLRYLALKLGIGALEYTCSGASYSQI